MTPPYAERAPKPDEFEPNAEDTQVSPTDSHERKTVPVSAAQSRVRGAFELDDRTDRDPSAARRMAADAAIESLSEGQTLDDFQLLQELGAGGAGRVFLARQRSMERLVALKVTVQRGAEPILLAQLDHPNIVRVYDERRLPGEGLRLMYMRYAPGGTLREVVYRLRRRPPAQRTGRDFAEVLAARLRHRGLDDGAHHRALEAWADCAWPETVCRVGAQLAEALAYAHARGVLHRDVKPANVLLDADGTPMLADFNIGAWNQPGKAPIGTFGGTPEYMSPEQRRAWDERRSARVLDLDGKSDVYTLALTLWELLHGRLPSAHELGEGPHPTGRFCRGEGEGVPDAMEAELTRVLCRCLREDPGARPDASRLARELRLVLSPEVRRLFRAPETGLRSVFRRFPRATLLAAALLPNGLAGAFNYVYNRQEIVEHLKGAEDAFWTIQAIINAIAFPLGLVLLLTVAHPVVRGLRAIATPAEKAAGRRRALVLGHVVAVVGMAEWCVAGLAYPVSLGALTGGVPPGVYVHFVASLVLCGLVAAAYPFFLIGRVAVGSHYPAQGRCLTGSDHGDTQAPGSCAADLTSLGRLEARASIYLLLAGAVPLLGVCLIVWSGREHSFALGVSSGVGLLGFALAFAMHRRLQREIGILREAIAATTASR